MGRHMEFEAWDACDEEDLRENGWEVGSQVSSGVRRPALAALKIGRQWHAIHVALTGGHGDWGESPAWLVVWQGEHVDDHWGGAGEALHLHGVSTVRKVANFLTTVPYEEMERRLMAARDGGVWIYSPEWSFDPDAGDAPREILRETYDALVTFYQDAATRGRVVRVVRV